MPTTVATQEKLPDARGRESAADGNGKTAAAESMKARAKKEKKDGSGSKRNKKAKKDAPKPLTKVGWILKLAFVLFWVGA